MVARIILDADVARAAWAGTAHPHISVKEGPKVRHHRRNVEGMDTRGSCFAAPLAEIVAAFAAGKHISSRGDIDRIANVADHASLLVF